MSDTSRTILPIYLDDTQPTTRPLVTYSGELQKISRTRQFVLEMDLISCQNAYTRKLPQWLEYTEDFSNAVWIKSGVTVTADFTTAPDGKLTADKLVFAAPGDSVYQDGSGSVVTSMTFTGSLFLKAPVAGTMTLLLSNAAETEFTVISCDVTTEWQRFHLYQQFSGVPVDAVRLSLVSNPGDLSTVFAWGGNASTNPANNNVRALFPYRKRVAEAVTELSVSASRCQAADAGVDFRCGYSPTTCQDFPNYNFGNEFESTPQNGLKTIRFCSKDAAMPIPGENVYPYLEDATFAAQEIYPDKSVTVSDRASARFIDDAGNMGNINQDRASIGALTNTNPPRGTFWRRFLALYPNYANPIQAVRIFEMFVPGTVADLQLRGSYVMLNVSLSSKGVFTMTLADRLKLLRTKAPAQISNDNLLQGTINSAQTVLHFFNTAELTPLAGTSLRSLNTDPEISSGEYQVVIEVDYDNGASEFMNVLQNNLGTNQLTVQRGRWGTPAVAHSDQAKWREVLMCGTENVTPSDPPRGKNPIDFVLELLARGLGNLISVNVAQFQSQRDQWVIGGVINNQNSGIVFKQAGGPVGTANSAIVTPTDIEILLRSLRDSLGLDIWIGEDQVVTGKIFAPPLATDPIPEVTTQANILADSVSLDDNQELSRFNRLIFAYNVFTGKQGTNLSDYVDYISYVGLDDELPQTYGQAKTKVILSPWVIAGDTTTAFALAARIYPRYRKPIRKLTAEFEIKDDLIIKTGDFLFVTWLEIVDLMGDPILNRFAQVLRKERSVTEGKFTALIYDLGVLDRYFIIAPNDITPDYDNASPAEQRYGYICNNAGRVGIHNDIGYRIY